MNNIKQPNQRRKTKNIKWERPKEGYAKLNCDAARNSPNHFTFGFAIRNHMAVPIAIGNENCNAESVLEAEAYALREGLIKVKELGVTSIEIEGDNLILINAINGTWKPPWEMNMIISDIVNMISGFTNSSAHHIFRKINIVADRIPMHELGSTIVIDSIPNDVEDLILRDALGRSVSRN